MAKSRRIKCSHTSTAPYQKPNPRQPAIFKFNTNVGQHILKNVDIANAIVAKANITQSDTVLEVGPGTGVLTTRILDKARQVIAVELDPRMGAELSKRVQGTPAQSRLQIILGDFIKLNMNVVPHFDVFISNTPYQISSPLLFKLLALPTLPRTSILMVQREFALRLLAQPGDPQYSRLSVNAQFFCRISHIMKVGRNNFVPPPQVESSVVRIEKRDQDRPDISWEEWDGMLRICFIRKHRTLRAIWTGSKVRAMIENNWIIWATMHSDQISGDDISILLSGHLPTEYGDPEPSDVDADLAVQARDEDDDINVTTPGKRSKSGLVTIGTNRVPRISVAELIMLKIRRVLESTNVADSRAATCTETDFLRLLLKCNLDGIHFS